MTSRTIVGPHSRQEHARFDEIDWIFHALRDQQGKGILVDVGAHQGHSFRSFAWAGWTVHAIEPLELHLAALARKWRFCANVHIHATAISDHSREATPFYFSAESDGISSLSPFLPSHKEIAKVKVITLADFLDNQRIQKVDFLKIDIEGYDLHALRGFPWSARSAPKVIACEFEDRKTNKLGYTLRDMAEYLSSRGYAVFVSEWHAIERYGIQHAWLGLKRYPCSLQSADNWGNLIAVREMELVEKLLQSAQRFLRMKEPRETGESLTYPVEALVRAADLADVFGDARVAVFGAGGYGRLAVQHLRAMGCRPVFAVDNDPNKHFGTLEELPIIPPGSLTDHDHDAVLIASDYAPAIYRQLLAARLTNTRLHVLSLGNDPRHEEEWQQLHSHRLESLRASCRGQDCFVLEPDALDGDDHLALCTNFHVFCAGLLPANSAHPSFCYVDTRNALDTIFEDSRKPLVFAPYHVARGTPWIDHPNLVPVNSQPSFGFSHNARDALCEGDGPAFPATQLAFYLGFERVFIGRDTASVFGDQPQTRFAWRQAERAFSSSSQAAHALFWLSRDQRQAVPNEISVEESMTACRARRAIGWSSNEHPSIG